MPSNTADDGTGLAQSRENKKGMGLHIMAYRASMIGASFKIERLPVRGTRVTCKLPSTPAIFPEIHAAKK